MAAKDIHYFSEELSISSEEYLQELKGTFCGKDVEIKFEIVDNKILQWKKGVWTRGKITLQPVSDMQIICTNFHQLLELHQIVYDKLEDVEEKNKVLLNQVTKLTTEIEEMIKVKNEIQQDLYKRFLLVLNAKKRKIRELQDKLDERNSIKDSIFDASTDESQEVDEEDDLVVKLKRNKCEKRKVVELNHCKTANKTLKIEESLRVSPKACTSKDYDNVKVSESNSVPNNEDVHKAKQTSNPETPKPKINLNFIEEESEDELFSQ